MAPHYMVWFLISIDSGDKTDAAPQTRIGFI